ERRRKRADPGKKWNAGDDTERPRRSRRLRHREEKQPEGDSDRAEGIPLLRRGEPLTDPDQTGRRDDAGGADGDDAQATPEGESFHDLPPWPNVAAAIW